MIAFSVVHLVLRHQETGEVFEDWEDIGTLVVAILALAVALPMSGLLGYHIMLTWSNRTTIEMVSPDPVRAVIVRLFVLNGREIHAGPRPQQARRSIGEQLQAQESVEQRARRPLPSDDGPILARGQIVRCQGRSTEPGRRANVSKV